ncbi:MAG: hypothetical protein KatS3mg099_059 [Candidatus Parcubacteria bacterium]|nr:MAG: hypothetical protein KatS3mg099_059 [Candidatus Parcubacteria bacterium]
MTRTQPAKTTLYGAVFTLAVAQIFPRAALAASNWSKVSTLVFGIREVLGLLIPVVFALILLVFLWGLVKFVWGASGDDKAQGKAFMFWGVVALFVAAAVWGVVNLLIGLFGVGSTGGVDANPTIRVNI